MINETLDRDALHWIITTYDMMALNQAPDVPTLLFERWAFSEQEVREALSLQPGDDLMERLSAYLEAEFGICDCAEPTEGSDHGAWHDVRRPDHRPHEYR